MPGRNGYLNFPKALGVGALEAFVFSALWFKLGLLSGQGNLDRFSWARGRRFLCVVVRA